MDLWFFEKEAAEKGCKAIAGIDEAGRGPLAGPVVSAAVILPPAFDDAEITDSKKLSPKKRERLYDLIYAQATAVGIGIVDAVEIDRINILQASLLSMAMAVQNLWLLLLIRQAPLHGGLQPPEFVEGHLRIAPRVLGENNLRRALVQPAPAGGRPGGWSTRARRSPAGRSARAPGRGPKPHATGCVR